MSGYVPLFSSLTTGTLCGKWPDLGLFPIVLSLADKNGLIDVTPDYLARITGLPVEDVTACMARFCELDTHSRSPEEGGARLALIDPATRPWGWRVVNHARYRERARKQQWDLERTESGRDAQRKRIERERARLTQSADVSRDVPPRPDCPRSQTQTQTQTEDSGVLEDSDSRPRQARTRAREREAYEREEFHRQVIATYHELLPDLPRVKMWSPKRAQALNARIRERCKDGKPADTVEYWRRLFAQVAASDFLGGRAPARDGREPFRADLEWLLRSENFAKVIEGRYNGPRDNGDSHAR